MTMARAIQRATKPLQDHLAGHHPWLATLLISVIGLTYLLRAGLEQLPLEPAAPAIGLWIGLGLALLAWQVTGIRRAIRESLKQPADIWAATGGYVTIVTAVVLVGLTMIDGTVRHLPQPAPTAARSGPTFDVSFDAETKSATLKGELNYASTTALQETIDQYRTTNTIILHSIGGHIFAARALANSVLKRNLDTHVDGHCYSACTIVFMAGQNRTLGSTASLGFHRYAYTNRFIVQTIDPAAEQARDLAFFRTRGISQDFLSRVFQTDHTALWKPDHKTLRAATVITTPTSRLPK